MAVKIRLQRKGRKKSPFYHIVVADARSPRDGKFIEKIGTYNPMTAPATIELDGEKAYEWMTKGAQPTETVRSIFRFKGVMYQKHLQRGVKKGAFTAEEAATMLATWVAAKEAKTAVRKAASDQEKIAHWAKINGIAPPKVVPVVETIVEAPAEEAEAPVVENNEEGGEA